MSGINKITTCCYCGHRSILQLTGQTMHTLSCASCGAPITKMHAIPVKKPTITKGFTPIRRNSTAPIANKTKPKKSFKKKKKSKRFFDFVEDAAEEIFDIFD